VSGGFGCDPRPGLGQLVDAIGDAVLAEIGQVGAEGVGLDRIDPHCEICVVDASHHVRTSDVQDLVAALVTLEVVHRRVSGLQHRAHRTIGNEDTLG